MMIKVMDITTVIVIIGAAMATIIIGPVAN